ncbi:MAG TPA: methyltransferase type 11 [Bacteroidales bacterium]|nr:methyltransferase [Lentimicrobiaceae bacterium]HAH58401.1 methyltransferase type 11 [Bacteroidales bacterium]
MSRKTDIASIDGSQSIQPIRPQPYGVDMEVVPYRKRMGPAYALEAILEGLPVLIADFYASGLEVLHEINQYIQHHHSGSSFTAKRATRAAYQELSNRVFLKINNHKLQVRKSPDIGWLKVLYPELEQFLLTFPQVQGLNSSWQWYEKGIFIPVLNRKIHPWYGTYFPTRFEHLELFGNWLKQYKGTKNPAIDVGIGSGILSMQMLNHGIAPVFGTDINPNAILGMYEFVVNNNFQSKLELSCGDLFDNFPGKAALIVFNPPWLPGKDFPGALDAAIYYPEDLFQRFFEQAANHMHKQSRLVVLFSNLAEIADIDAVNPIIRELDSGNRFHKVQLITKQVRAASSKTKRKSYLRSKEKVELWELKLKAD